MQGLVFGLMGMVLLVFGILRAGGAREAWVRRKRVRGARLLNIGAATRAGSPSPVWVAGVVTASEQGTVTATLSGRSVVWLRTLVEEQRRSGRNTTWVVLADEVYARDFLLADGSGGLRVRPQRAHVMVTKKRVAKASWFRSPPPELRTFLADRQLPHTTFLGIGRTFRAYEETVAEGDRIFALGPAQLEAGDVETAGYRSAPTQALVLAGPVESPVFDPEAAAAGELLLSDRPPPKVAQQLLLQASAGYGLLGAGLLLVLYALASLIFSAPG